ncbi:MAG TPA: Tex-like N-terminal domain-containing protein, partial [Chloroflexota bacterium]|nr:Tex-like N-terminal domain-containing protein [Chloroflexota bacterium]
MSDPLAVRIAAELGVATAQVARTLALLDDGNTIPFIARYRKEVTGGLDEVPIAAIGARAAGLRAVEERRAEIVRLIAEQGKLTEDLAAAIARAETLAELDDLYLPYRPKRRTRAMIARERGLEPLAEAILTQARQSRQALASHYVDTSREVPTTEDALAGARDIVAEVIAEDAEVRGELRAHFTATGMLSARVAHPEQDAARTYAHYYEFSEPLAGAPPHRILAINRGEREGVLKVGVEIPDQLATGAIARFYTVDDRSPLAGDLRKAAADSYARLLAPSLEREMRAELTARAERHAIDVFALNLRPLLLQPPLRGRTVIGIDPGFRTGCKVAVVDETGRLLAGTTIYPHAPRQQWAQAKATLQELAQRHGATIFAIGNGTAGRESEALIAELIAETGGDLSYAVVDESGASVYSVSEVAREEFPSLEATERGVVSIARRLQDPLAELVKIEPQAVGVGLYQHDVNQKELADTLDRVVESAVTFAGVDLNTASIQLLSRVAGLNRKVAAAIVRYREQHGKFRARQDLLKVPGLGPRTFQQVAGFLKIPGG